VSDFEGKRRRDVPELGELRRRLESAEGREFWRSLEELARTEEFVEALQREFPENAAELSDPVSRRGFLKLMGASLALAGAAGCVRQSSERIVPYVRQPEELVPGKPLHYASAATRGGYGQGVLVESHMGRPTKIEGNPDHPSSLGATDAITQAEVLTLYDPDRSQVVRRNGRITTWEAFLATLTAFMEAKEPQAGAGVRLLTGTVTSPTLADQIDRLRQRFPEARWHQWEPAGRDAVRAGTRRAFGEPVQTRYRFDRAEVVLSLGADFLTGMPGSVRYARDFADGRRVRRDRREMNRLYAFESTPTPTGALADHRWPVRPSDMVSLARALAGRLGVDGVDATAADGELPEGLDATILDAVAGDLRSRAGAAAIVPGDEQEAEVHVLAHAMNLALGNAGTADSPVVYTDPVEAEPVDQLESLRSLVADMRAGEVEALVILGGNPVYDAPADLDFTTALEQVEVRVHLGLYEDETSQYCHWHVPEAHFLEAWGDVRGHDGSVSIVQPLIEPLFNGHSAVELMAVLLGQPERDGYDIVRAHWQERHAGATGASGEVAAEAVGAPAPRLGLSGTPPEFDDFWQMAVHDGVVPGTAAAERQVELAETWDLPELRLARAGTGAGPAPPDGLEVVFRPDPTIHDGSHANNGWLQELPKPLTKLTWDNAAFLSPATAERLGVASEQVVELSLEGRTVRAPVWILPGQADDSVTLHLGYGRRRTGRVGRDAGFDAYRLRTTRGPWAATGLAVEPTDERLPLASTQDHHSMEGRELVRVGTLADYREHAELPGEHHEAEEDVSLYPEWEYDGYSWGMEIDLNVCTGCNGCMTACQAENNVPVVGKDQVLNGREMHWLRIDRYWSDSLDAPDIHFQPVPCMHCENAPCEVVCPVAATVHGDEGLNQMIYNRCVGTRYCANNCPYKVRRFNFFEYADHGDTPIMKLLQNPDVSVRSRGVMEKCTYCVQRINVARVEAKNEGREIRDGEVVPACAQACPTQAITFGDINDPDSEVSRLREEPLHYGLLTHLGTRPRTNYLARLRNPNPALEAGASGEATAETVTAAAGTAGYASDV